jgi:large subunit ribosomal protein L34
MTTKRTLEGTNRKSIRKSGFRARISSNSGLKILNNRRKKGRKKLTISQ